MTPYSLRSTLCALSITVLPFCGIGPALAQSASTPLLPHPFIYEVRQAGNHHVSYIFGSFHYGFSTSDLPFWVQRLHHNARLNFYEIELENVAEYEAEENLYFGSEKVSMLGRRKNSTDTIARLIEAGISARAAPFFPVDDCESAAYFYSFALQRVWRSLDGELQIDSKTSGKQVKFLDTDEIRAQAEQKVVEPETPCVFSDMLADPTAAKDYLDQVKAGLKDLGDLYQNGDEADFMPEKDEVDTFYRNQIWIEKLTPELKRRDSFVVVGAFHLFGDQGLIARLKARGFEVHRLIEDPLPNEKYIRYMH